MNIDKLKGKIKERGFTVKDFAEKIGVERTSLYRKLNNAERITIGEADRMKETLNLSNAEATEIFFAE